MLDPTKFILFIGVSRALIITPRPLKLTPFRNATEQGVQTAGTLGLEL